MRVVAIPARQETLLEKSNIQATLAGWLEAGSAWI
jgi:hypothetical protein